jgi:hypothetical protein
MGTDFEWMGRVVAHRSWGGRDVGTRVELTLDATSLPDMDCTLKGDDGSRATLRELVGQTGRGRCPEWNPCGRRLCPSCTPELAEAVGDWRKRMVIEGPCDAEEAALWEMVKDRI